MAVSEFTGLVGDTKLSVFEGLSTPGVEQELVDDLVPPGSTRLLTVAVVICRMEGRFVITKDGDTIGSGRTGPGVGSSEFSWNPPLEAEAGAELKVLFEGMAGRPAVDLEAYLQAVDV